MEQLTIGNIVTVSVNLYRQNFKQYLKYSFIANLWLIIPLYGWGKYLETAADISYESFKQLLLLKYAKYQFKKNNSSFLWLKYLFIFLLNSLICFIFISIFFILLLFLLGAITVIFQDASGNSFLDEEAFEPIIGTIVILYIILTFIYPYSRLFVTDIVLAEDKIKSIFTPTFKSISLTNRFSLKTLAIILLCFTITIPLIVLSFSIIFFLAAFFIALIQQVTEIELDSNRILWICLIFWFLFVNFLTMPLWQSVKAAVYYRIMCDKKAFDLTILSP